LEPQDSQEDRFEWVLLDDVDSTNRYLRDALNEGKLSHAAVSAERQSAGRGRMDRSWQSPPGNLYLSLSFPVPEALADKAMFFNVALAVSVAELLRGEFDLDVRLKWPNDLVYEGSKLGGLLSELVRPRTLPLHLIAGLGLNVNTAVSIPDALLLPVSLFQALGRRVEIKPLREALARGIFRSWVELVRSGSAGFIARWRTLADMMGREVEVRTAETILTGRALGIGEDFELLLDTGSEILAIHEGDCRRLR